MPPLRNAVRLVDGEKGEAGARQQLQATRRHQPLGRDIEQIEGPVANGALDLGGLAGRQPRIEGRRAHPRLAQRVDLVLHQRDQRRHDDADARTQQRRDLVAQRLAAAGRHQHDGVAADDDVFDNRKLLAAEAVKPENLAQHPLGLRSPWPCTVKSAVFELRGAVEARPPALRGTLLIGQILHWPYHPAATSKKPYDHCQC